MCCQCLPRAITVWLCSALARYISSSSPGLNGIEENGLPCPNTSGRYDGYRQTKSRRDNAQPTDKCKSQRAICGKRARDGVADGPSMAAACDQFPVMRSRVWHLFAISGNGCEAGQVSISWNFKMVANYRYMFYVISWKIPVFLFVSIVCAIVIEVMNKVCSSTIHLLQHAIIWIINCSTI